MAKKKAKRRPTRANNVTRLATLEQKVDDLKELICLKTKSIQDVVDKHEERFTDIYQEFLRLNRNLSFFRGKVIGVAVGASTVLSIAIPLIILAIKKL